jgi:hypothetical protein
MDETLSDYTTVSKELSSEVQARKAKSKKKKTESKVPPIAKTMESIKRLEEQMKGEELLRKKKYMAGGKVSSSSKYKCSHNSLY